ncbi:MAG: hypothetical protein ACKVJQ_11085 [Alphaproteobacteria bacterium]|jgi:hypothetical protein
MTDVKEEPSWYERKENVTRIYQGVWVICGLLALADFFYHKHIIFKVEGFPAFYGLYGFIGCVGLVLGAKQLRKILKRDEDYYDR